MAPRASASKSSTPGSVDTGPALAWPVVMPVRKPQLVRRVGTVSAFFPRKAYGVLVDENGGGEALFTADDVLPEDRHRLASGVTVTYLALHERDGVSARQVRVDRTTLPPPPPDQFFTKGWR